MALGTSAAVAAAEAVLADAPYRVVDGRVDDGTYNGFRRYHAGCNHCHGADGVGGSFAPSLISAPAEPDGFRMVVLNGSRTGASVMKGFSGDANVEPHIDDIYAYLRARADGVLGRGRPARLDDDAAGPAH